MTDFSKEEKGLLKFRKCGVWMTRNKPNKSNKNDCFCLFYE